jgi:hypothetical protein
VQHDHKITRITFYGIAIILAALVILFPPANVFAYDVFGYYMYLPLSFKYDDLTIHNYKLISETLNTYHASETFYQAVKWDNGNWVMRYPIGLSIFYAPFYFIADLIAPHTSYPADGFSRPYQLSVLYGCLIYTLAGLYFIKKTLTVFFSDTVTALILIGIALGTNYFFHTSMHGQGAMSHNLLFTLYAIIIYLTIQWHKNFSVKISILLGICVGMCALCRPSEIISGLIPLLYGVTNWKTFKEKLSLLLKLKKQLVFFGLSLFCVGLIQLSYYKYASGRFFINPYGSGNPGEGLELLRPHLLEVLFSFRKGWFVYTPLMFFIVFGFAQMYRKNKDLFLPILVYTLVALYIVASWSCWWFGSCFGNRALIATYAALSIPLGYFMEYVLNTKNKLIYLTLFFIFIYLNLFQSWQIHKGIMDTTNMSRAYYFSTFLQINPPTHDQTRLLLKGKSNTEIEQFTEDDVKKHCLNFALFNNYENRNDAFVCDTISHSGKHSLVTNAFSLKMDSIVIPHNLVTSKSYTWIKASVWVFSRYSADELDARFEIHMTHKNWIFKPVKYPLNNSNFKAGRWNKLEYYYLTPDDLRSKKDKICIYFINNSNKNVYIDDLLLESYEPIHDVSVF